MSLLIQAAVIRTRKGIIHEGLSHNDIRLMGGVTGDEGYLLSDGRFVGRLQAARIAVDAKQAPLTVLYQLTGLSSSDLDNNFPPEEPAL